MSTIIVGAGGHGAVVYDTFVNRYDHKLCLDVYDDNATQLLGHPVKGTVEQAMTETYQHDKFIIAIGNNEVREKFGLRVINEGAELAMPLVHKKAYVSNNASVGRGTVVFAGAMVQARAQIGYGVIINTGATVDHDCIIYDFAHICPGVNLAGNVKVGQRTMIGIGSCVIQGITIGDDITVGAGSVVVDDLLEPGLYMGAPARRYYKDGCVAVFD